MSIINVSKPIFWNDDKNAFLKKERGISFEAIIVAMERGHLIASREHPKYLHQRIFEVTVDDYIVVVPYVEDKDKIFLKTAFYSRKANKAHKEKKHDA